jgi:hypothetical protein
VAQGFLPSAVLEAGLASCAREWPGAFDDDVTRRSEECRRNAQQPGAAGEHHDDARRRMDQPSLKP